MQGIADAIQRPLTYILIILVLALAASRMVDVPTGDAGEDRLGIYEVQIVAGEERHRFTVEMAETPQQRSRGLMERTELAVDAGMLFDYGSDKFVSFWMKNTLIPLDMLFIKSDGRIVRIAERTTPLSLVAIPSGEAVRAVLEVNGGTADRLGIAAGDRVIHPIFGNTE